MSDAQKREKLHLLVESLEGENLDLVLAIIEELLEMQRAEQEAPEDTDRVMWESATWGKEPAR